MSINYTNKTDPFIHHELIDEWDISSANVSIIEYYSLASKKIIDKLKTLDKSERVIMVGKLMRKDKDFSINLERAFDNIITEFIEANNIDKDNIVAIKKDALFVRNQNITKSKFGSVNFINKHSYTGAILLKNLEFYINKNSVDIKGVNDNNLQYHSGTIEFVKNVINLSYNKYEQFKYIKEYCTAYKNRELEFDDYRELQNSMFRVYIMGDELLCESIDDDLLEMTDISWNYINIIMPIIKMIWI